MVRFMCMRKSPPRSANDRGIILEFPAAPNFESRPPQINPQVMLERIAQNMERRKKRPDEAARRAAEKIPVEFVL